MPARFVVQIEQQKAIGVHWGGGSKVDRFPSRSLRSGGFMKLGHTLLIVGIVLLTMWVVNRVPAIGNIVK
jgi:hypothetical protein